MNLFIPATPLFGRRQINKSISRILPVESGISYNDAFYDYREIAPITEVFIELGLCHTKTITRYCKGTFTDLFDKFTAYHRTITCCCRPNTIKAYHFDDYDKENIF